MHHHRFLFKLQEPVLPATVQGAIDQTIPCSTTQSSQPQPEAPANPVPRTRPTGSTNTEYSRSLGDDTQKYYYWQSEGLYPGRCQKNNMDSLKTYAPYAAMVITQNNHPRNYHCQEILFLR